MAASGRYFRLSRSGTAFEWREVRSSGDVLLDSFDLRPMLQTWYNKRPEYDIRLTPAEATVNLVSGSATLRVLVESGELIVQKGVPHAEFLNGLIFLRENPKRR